MRRIFADTSYFVALVQSDDQAHLQAFRFAVESTTRVVTTEWVLVEVANFFSRPSLRTLFTDLIAQIDLTCEVIVASHETFVSGMELFARRADKEWSLTDCISFEAMRARSISMALTTDHHFEQAGFIALLK